MIWSTDRKFCFVHIPKTGGTSITAAYEPSMLFNDVVLGGTPLGEALQPPYRARFGLHKHSGAQGIAHVVGRERFGAAFSVALLRDPLDRMLSFHRWLRRTPMPGNPLRDLALARDFDDFVPEAVRDLVPQAAHVTIGEAVALTRLYRFADLPRAWAAICAEIGVAGPIGHENASGGEAIAPGPRARALVEDAYRADYRLLERTRPL